MIIDVNTPSRNYKVLAERGGFSKLTYVLEQVADGCSLAVLTDDKVDSLYADRLAALLDEWKHPVIKYVIKNGEASKNPENLFSFLEFMAENGICRSDCIIALGGGVVGDMAGFAASIYQRGIKFIQIPTTLLAMVDSSVGGKTAVDLKAGKNLAGAFWQPEAVYCDPDVLDTLGREEYLDGIAEIIKYGVISDESIIDELEADNYNIEKIIAECIKIKADIVARDERESGERKLLNLGHTVGHAVEKLSGYKVSHGHAVAIGMCIISRAVGVEYKRISGIVARFGLPVSCEYSAEQLYNVILSDKKAHGGFVDFVVPEKIGKCYIKTVANNEITDILRLGLSE